MARGVLTQAEIDALMELFGTRPPSERQVKASAVPEPAIGALRSELEATARQWAAALETLTGAPSTVTLHTIVRRGRTAGEEGQVLLRCAEGDRFLIVPESLVNLLNERSLGALEPDPLLGHALTAIDKALFEMTGGFLAGGGSVEQVAQLPAGEEMLEARFDIAVAPILRTTLSIVLYDKPV